VIPPADPSLLAQILEAVKTIGVPAAITFIVLWRVEHKLDKVIALLERAAGRINEQQARGDR
jgi:hypothetical protein